MRDWKHLQNIILWGAIEQPQVWKCKAGRALGMAYGGGGSIFLGGPALPLGRALCNQDKAWLHT